MAAARLAWPAKAPARISLPPETISSAALGGASGRSKAGHQPLGATGDGQQAAVDAGGVHAPACGAQPRMDQRGENLRGLLAILARFRSQPQAAARQHRLIDGDAIGARATTSPCISRMKSAPNV